MTDHDRQSDRRRADAAHEHLRDVLYERLRGRPTPLLVAGRSITPGASLWSTARLWVRRFRELGIEPGDRVVLALPAGQAFLAAMVAGLWERVALVPIPPGSCGTDAMRATGARAVIVEADTPGGLDACAVRATATGAPSDGPARLRPRGEAHPDIALVMATSGTTGSPRRVAISFDALVAQVSAHAGALGASSDDVCLSVLPWCHAFGLVIDLLPAVLGGATVVADASLAADGAGLRDAARDYGATRLSAVPQTVRVLASVDGGMDVLRVFRGGVGGGARVPTGVARVLAETRLRPGYGLTEAGPGVTLGSPGVWQAGAMGEPIGCEVRVGEGGVLAVRGAGTASGWFADGALTRRDRRDWLATGDVVERSGGGLVFLGRADHRFKLENGRMVDVPALEDAIERRVGHEVVVLSRDTRTIDVIVVWDGVAAPRDVRADVAAAMGRLSARLGQVRIVGQLDRTRKGECVRTVGTRAFGAIAA